MAYNNNNRSRNTNNNSQTSSQNNSVNATGKKHSGAKEGVTNGKKWIKAWNYSKGKGMVSVLIAEYHGSKTTVNEAGEESRLLMASIFYVNTGVTILEPCFYKVNTGKVVLRKLGWVVNTKAPNGGYCGRF